MNFVKRKLCKINLKEIKLIIQIVKINYLEVINLKKFKKKEKNNKKENINKKMKINLKKKNK